MTAKRVLNHTRFSSFYIDVKRFLPLHKNVSPYIHGNTLAESIKYYDDRRIGSVAYSMSLPDDYRPEYEFIPYGDYYPDALDDTAETIELFGETKQHHIYAVYKISDQLPIEEVRNEFLIPFYDKIYGLDSCWTYLSFINRLDSEYISIEIFLFGTADIDQLIIYDIIQNSYLFKWRFDRLAPHNAMYWFYKFHYFLYYNPSILTGAACLIALNSKPVRVDLPAIVERFKSLEGMHGPFYSNSTLHSFFQTFEEVLNDTIRDGFWGCAHFHAQFLQIGREFRHYFSSVGAGLDYPFQFALTEIDEDRWWGVDTASKIGAAVALKDLAITGSEKDRALLQEFLRTKPLTKTSSMQADFLDLVDKTWLENFWKRFRVRYMN